MTIRYYDPVHGRYRVKRRYAWATYAFAIGALCGVLLVQLR